MKTLALMVALVTATGLFAATHGPGVEEELGTSTVFLVRHAEKSRLEEHAKDPPLTEAGQRRAEALARLLFRAGVTQVYTSQYTRTKQTVQPLAHSLGLTSEIVPAQDPIAQVAALQSLPTGSVALVAGHSNTVPRLVEALGGSVTDLVDVPPYGGILEDDSYDRLFMVTLGKGVQTRVVELRFGAPTP